MTERATTLPTADMNREARDARGPSDASEANAPSDTSEASEPRALARLAGGYALHVRDEGSALDVHAPDGRLCVRLVLAADGPRIEISGASLAVHAEREIALSCQRFTVDAAEGLALRSGADLEVRAEGALRSEGFSQAIVARRGDVDIQANDDVAVDGERIRLNSPEPIVRR